MSTDGGEAGVRGGGLWCRDGSHLVIGRAEEVVTCRVEAQPRHRALVGTDNLHARGVGHRPDANSSIGRS